MKIDDSKILNLQKNSKNTVKASIPDPANNWATRSVSFFNSDFVKADRGLVKTGSYTVSGITNYYNARIRMLRLRQTQRKTQIHLI